MDHKAEIIRTNRPQTNGRRRYTVAILYNAVSSYFVLIYWRVFTLALYSTLSHIELLKRMRYTDELWNGSTRNAWVMNSCFSENQLILMEKLFENIVSYVMLFELDRNVISWKYRCSIHSLLTVAWKWGLFEHKCTNERQRART